MSNFNEIFRKDVSYDNVKSHKKAGLRPLCRRFGNIFGKITGERGLKLTSFSLFRVSQYCQYLNLPIFNQSS